MGPLISKGTFCVVREIYIKDSHRLGEENMNTLASLSGDEEREVKRSNPVNMEYAIKMVRTDVDEVEQSKSVDDLLNESRILSKMCHPNIISLMATIGDVYRFSYSLILEKVHYTLREKVNVWEMVRSNRRFSLGHKKDQGRDRQLKIGLELACGLQHLHDHNVIHRDLKPGNIGFTIEGKVKLLDFGLSREITTNDIMDDRKLYKLTGHAGSKRYMAPEVFLCLNYNYSADVYSFGLLMWLLLSKSTPFPGINQDKYVNQVVSRGMRPIIPSTWSPTVAKLVELCWSSIIEERPDFIWVCDVLSNESKGTHKRRSSLSKFFRRSSISDVSSRRTSMSADELPTQTQAPPHSLRKKINRRNSL